MAITAYIGRGHAFARGIGEFARAYARQTRADRADLVAAIANGQVDAAPGW
ncbi:hypothetical protein ACIRRA_43820 [Nocardia sp. NPDC101769]|uniref:hypothetical protein n=1 Tax=Nocardia sp. NPDC101769 TaxID=3364333 RepID=UPI003809810A